MSDPSDVLLAWPLPAAVRAEPATSGLINRSWIVVGDGGPIAVLQRLNPAVFDPRVTENIDAVTRHLAARGIETPLVRPTRAGALWHDGDDGAPWRLLGYVGDRTVDKLADPRDATSAGALVARFHAALADFDRPFAPIWAPALLATGTRARFHDTAAFVAGLRDVVPRHRDHRLYDQVAPLADAIAADFAAWDGPRDLPARVVHGDLKISNVRFRGAEAIALIDLDTLTTGTLDAELGDAFRSWCNPAAEDALAPRFDLALFEAAARGYHRGAAAAPPTDAEWASFAAGAERIALELAARFARDALEESYFGFDPRYGGRGEHNLLRARGQHALARSVRAARAEADEIVRRVRST